MTTTQLYLFPEVFAPVEVTQDMLPVPPKKLESDNSYLLKYQWDFFTAKTEKERELSFGYLLLRIESTAKKMIRNEFKKRGVYISADTLADKAADCMQYFAGRFRRGDGFFFKKSASGYIYLSIQRQVNYRTKASEACINVSHNTAMALWCATQINTDSEIERLLYEDV